jgi:hypothetical protein
MVSLGTQLNLEADEEAVVVALDDYDGTLFRDTATAGLYWLVLKRNAPPREMFCARIAWSGYPEAPPSVRFTDGIGGPWNVNRAWPNIPGYRIGSFDICQPFTEEGFALHPEWRTGPHAWRTTGNPFHYVVNRLQLDLNNRYQGRHA